MAVGQSLHTSVQAAKNEPLRPTLFLEHHDEVVESRQDGVRHGSGRHGRLCRGYQGCNRELIGLCSTEKVNGLEG